PEVDVVGVRARDDVRTRVAIDVDGPRFPRHRVRDGGRDVAREAGVVIPVVGGTLVARQDAAADAVRELEARGVDGELEAALAGVDEVRPPSAEDAVHERVPVVAEGLALAERQLVSTRNGET